MANPDEEEAQLLGVPPSKEEEEDRVRLQELAEELAAESRTTFDDKTNTMNLNKKKVTDYHLHQGWHGPCGGDQPEKDQWACVDAGQDLLLGQGLEP